MNSPLTASDLMEFHLDDSVEAARWDELVARSPDADVYHRAAYVLASAELEHSQPLGLMISSCNRQYLLPMLLRPISSPDGQSWADASTPYGYGGVICLGFDSGAASPDGADLFQHLLAWSATRRLVSCVLRSHPLLIQDWLFAHALGIDFAVTRRGQTVAVPLELWNDARQCPAELSKGRRSDLALARRNLRVTLNGLSDQRDALEQFRIFRGFLREHVATYRRRRVLPLPLVLLRAALHAGSRREYRYRLAWRLCRRRCRLHGRTKLRSLPPQRER